jgi:copper resistance protein D
MFILPTAWELASLVCKLFLYLGAASIAGGSLCAWQFSAGQRQTLSANLGYMVFGALLGFQSVLLNFLIQVGLINDHGVAGMFDWDMASLLLGTTLGDVTFVRLAGFVLALITNCLMLRKLNQLTQAPAQVFYRILISSNFLALLMLAFSFRVAGHISVLNLTAQIAVVLHILAFTVWIGCLLPLMLLTQSADMASLKHTMKRFADNAVVVLAVLVIAGVLMLLQLIASPNEMITSAYGLSLLVKFLLVAAMLGVAAINKLFLVPRIISQTDAGKLRTSIRYEMLLAALILMLTAYLSTVIGPSGH